jgi:hypothetical protein
VDPLVERGVQGAACVRRLSTDSHRDDDPSPPRDRVTALERHVSGRIASITMERERGMPRDRARVPSCVVATETERSHDNSNENDRAHDRDTDAETSVAARRVPGRIVKRGAAIGVHASEEPSVARDEGHAHDRQTEHYHADAAPSQLDPSGVPLHSLSIAAPTWTRGSRAVDQSMHAYLRKRTGRVSKPRSTTLSRCRGGDSSDHAGSMFR